MTKRNDDRVTVGSSNPYEDFGRKDPNIALFKSDLAGEIRRAIDSLAITQEEAAEIMATDQAKVSAIICGRLSGFSVERLIRFLSRLGYQVRLDAEFVADPITGKAQSVRKRASAKKVTVPRKVRRRPARSK